MIIINQVKFEVQWTGKKISLHDMLVEIEQLQKRASKILHVQVGEIKNITILKHSLDARKKPQIFQVYSLGIELLHSQSEEKIVRQCKNANVIYQEYVTYKLPPKGQEKMLNRPVIVGMGPAGLFCGYILAQEGYRPIIVERGLDVDRRTVDVENFWNGGQLKINSNVQFGEGGAGTFSDGKLNTLVKDKKGRNRKVLEMLVEAGAPDSIIFEQKPHIGTDVLKNVVKKMRMEILAMGGDVYFESQLTQIRIEDGKVKQITINDSQEINTDVLVLAIGHSARDTFSYLEKIGVPMEAKSFAVGMRVEHPQSLINEAMYGKEHGVELPAAPYKLTAKTSTGRGVYSFCMCPGGYVVNASSEPGRLAVNGMSYSDRGSRNANSAIIVTVTPEDFPGNGPLAGVEFQRRLEENAYRAGNGKIPVQYYKDYREDTVSVENESYNIPCMKGDYQFTNLRHLLPDECETAFMEGMEHFEHLIKGFASDDALLSGFESRTSSPVRIHRTEECQSPEIEGLYPCGEGAGYAGGITSAAMDGLLIAEKIMEKFNCFS